MKKSLSVLALVCLALVVNAGGGWTSGKGKGYFKLGQQFIVSGYYFAPDGSVVDITTTGYFATSIYGEYGLTNRIDVIAYVPFFARATLNELQDAGGTVITPGDALTSFGDTDITLKYGIIKDQPVVLAASLTFGLPLGNPAGGDSEALQTGDGEFNQMLTLEVSGGFGKGYASGLIGYNNRTKGFSPELRYGLEGGISFGDFYGILRMYGVLPLGEEDPDVEPPKTGLFSNRIEYLSVTPEIIYNISDSFGVSAAAGFAPYGKRILASPNFTVGAFLKI